MTGASRSELADAATVLKDHFLPADREIALRPLQRLKQHKDLSIHTLGEMLRSDIMPEIEELFEGTEPLLILMPDETALPDALAEALPAPLKLAPLSRQIILALLHLTYAPLDLANLPALLPSEADFETISAAALSFALRASSAEEAARRITRALPKPAPTPQGPTLEDLTGAGEALLTARRIVADLALWQSGEVDWSDVTRSLLLFGPPGTGKTYLARAMGASADVNFVSASFGEWQAEGHLGKMLAAMRASFEEARNAAPSVLFVDEIDAAGSRWAPDRHNREYRRQVINTFLAEIDATARAEGVVFVGATNDRSALDPAILRPGRLDLHVAVPLPDAATLIGVLQKHINLPDDQLRHLAQAAVGMSAADLDAAIRAAKSSVRAKKRPLELHDLHRQIGGLQQTDPEVIWRSAVHEIGHAIAFAELCLGTISRVLIRRDGGGEAHPKPSRAIQTLADIEDELTFLLAGRAAERLVLGEVSAGAGGSADSDLALATRRCVDIETRYGLGHHGRIWLDGIDEVTLRNPHVYAKVRKRLETAERRADALLEAQRDRLEAAARELCERQELGEQELARLLSPNSDRRSQSSRAERRTNEIAPFA
ncbi:AAA family ATPase [Thioclava electrotropha]|uniref:AAA family ATPase n=1 Tax=Thioclava electrotropha TaxID=1549850 RepID=UPI0023A7998E|nr:AAA family ATPase [Thioclava electrotropha]